MLTYASYVNEITNLLPTEFENTRFFAIIPNVIDAAEQRIYRELNLLGTVVRDASTNLTANSRSFTLPQSLGRFVTVTGVNVITPVGTTTTNGTRNALQPIWRNLLDFLFPLETAVGVSVPSRFAMITDQQIIVGPPPNAAYNIEVIGTIRPTPLSATNATTYLSTFLPDLFIDASMVFISEYEQDLGQLGPAVSNPQMLQSWESKYQLDFASANAEELRKKYNQDVESRARP